jgi:adenylate cyclase
MPGSRLSAGVEAAWQIGADFALQTESEYIEPIHILYGLFSLKKYADAEPNVAGPKREEIATEAAGLMNLCQGSEPSIPAIRKDIRESFSNTSRRHDGANRRMSRSPATRRVFEAAEGKAGNAKIDAPRLLLSILETDDAWVHRHIAPELAERLRRAFAPEMHDSFGISKIGAAYISAPDEHVHVAESLDASVVLPRNAESLDGRFAQLCELSWEFGIRSPLEPMLQSVAEQLLRIVPKAEFSCVLLTDAAGELLLKAHAPEGTPELSLTCARRAVAERKSLLWSKQENLSESQFASNVQSGIYAPLVAEGSVLGIVCINTSCKQGTFDNSDLNFVTAAAHHLALVIANRNLQVKLATNAEVLERLLTNFSPQVRKRLVQRAQQGRLRLGGERSQVTILCSDIRGFTRLSANMEAEDIVAMLNEYFSALTECIFRNDGTVDKFVGDAILAVFGSPDPDPQHRKKAVQAAVEMQQAMEEVNRVRAKRSEPTCAIGIGIHTGEVLHGFIGSMQRMEYTVIGDAVNKTSRFCDGAEAGQVLISPEVHQYLWRTVEGVPVSISTKHEGEMRAYRVLSLRAGASAS